MINSFIIYKFFKDFINHRKKTSRVVAFSYRPFPNILKGTLMQIWKSANIYVFMWKYVEEFTL